jgi:hypothetical protein
LIAFSSRSLESQHAMNFKTTAFLLVLLVIVGAYFLLVEHGREATPHDLSSSDSGEGQPLFAHDAVSTDRVQSLTLMRERQQIVFEHVDGDWRQVEPVRFPLNTWSMRNLIDQTTRLRYSERFEPGRRNAPSLADVGLLEPLATLTIRTEEGSTQKVALGRQTIGGRGYARLNDDPQVYVINDALHRELLDKKIGELRQKSLSAPSEGQAQWLRLRRDGQTIEATKHDGQWTLAGDHRGRVGASAVRDMLAAVSATWIRRFVADGPEDLAPYGLDRPAIELHIRQTPDAGDDSVQGTLTVLRIGSPVDLQRNEFFATISEHDESTPGDAVVFTINRSDMDKLDKPVDEWRDPRITPLRSTDVGTLKIERDGVVSLHVERDPSGWDFADAFAPGFKADSGLIADLVASIVRAEAQDYHLSPRPLDTPAFRVTLDAIARPAPDLLSVLEYDQQQWLVYRGEEPVGYLVPRQRLSGLEQPMDLLRQRLVLDWKPADLTELNFTQEDGTTVHFTRGADGHWTLVGHDRFEQAALDRLLAHLLPLQALRWEPQARVGSNPVQVHLRGADGSSAVLAVDPRARLGQFQGVETTMELSGDLIDALSAEFRDRKVLEVSMEQVAEIVITRGDSVVTIRRELGQYIDSEGNALDQAATRGVFDVLTSLRADRHADAGDTDASEAVHFAIHALDGQVHELLLVPGDEATGPRARINDRWFTLSNADYERLTAPLQ